MFCIFGGHRNFTGGWLDSHAKEILSSLKESYWASILPPMVFTPQIDVTLMLIQVEFKLFHYKNKDNQYI